MGREETVRLPTPAPEGEAGDASTPSAAATRTGTHRRRNTLLASGPVALLVAVVAGFLVLSPMLNAGARWPDLPSGMNWPLSSLNWPGGHQPQDKAKPVAAASPTHTPAQTPTPHLAEPTPEPTAEPTPKPEPTRVPISTPTPPRPVPTPAPTLVPTPAPTPTPQPTPTPPLFYDTFTSGIGPSWTRQSGTWTAGTDGIPVARGADTSLNPAAFAIMTAGSPAWTDVTIKAKVKPSSVSFGGVIARYQDQGDFYFCGFDQSQITVGKYLGGSPHTESITFAHPLNQFYDVTFKVVGATLTCTVTDPLNKVSPGSHELVLPSNYIPEGAIGLIAKPDAEFGYVVVRAA